MGCCQSENKKSLLEESHKVNNQENVTSIISQNNNNSNGITTQVNENIKGNINDNPPLKLSQNEIATSTISFNKNPNNSLLSNDSKNKMTQLISSYNETTNFNLGTGNSLFSCINTFEAHDDKIVSLIELSNTNIASGSYDSTIKIWDVPSQRCIIQFKKMVTFYVY